jgi:replicative DNA helicase
MREQEVSAISRSLKAIAKELDVPILALSQLSRAVETRGGAKRPQLSDLRESGAIEQDADIVMFVNRPEYFHIFKDEKGFDWRGKAEIIIAKHRNGGLDNVPLIFRKEYARFMNLDDETLAPPPGDVPMMRGSRMNADMVPEPDYVPEMPGYLQNQQMPPELMGGGNEPMPF